jgi:hypothetical protein
MKTNQYVLEFHELLKYLTVKKTFTIVPEDEEITISSFNEKMTVPLHLQKC